MADLVIIKGTSRSMRRLGEGVIEICVPLSREERLTINPDQHIDPCLVIRLDAETIARLRKGSS